MSKKIIVISILGFVLFFISYLLFFNKNKSANTNFVEVTKGDITVKVIAVGNIVSAETAAVKSQISGTVAQLFHAEGDAVKKSDPLLMVKPQPTPADYAAAKQQVEIDLAKEKTDLAAVNRYEYLLKKHTISKVDKDYLNAIKDYQVDKLTRELDENTLALLEQGKANIQGKAIDNIILSPIDGYIVERLVNVGDSVVPQTDYQAGNVLFTIADMNHLIFKGQVSEADAAKLHLGVAATVKLAALADIAIPGHVNRLALQSVQLATSTTVISSGNNNSNSSNTSSPFNVGYKVEIDHLVVPKNITLKAGYSATAEIITDTAKQVLIIPERILEFEQDKTYVWKLDGKNKPEKCFITLGLTDGVNVQILSGLKPGDRLLETPPDANKET